MSVTPTLDFKISVNHFILLYKFFSVFSLHNQIEIPFLGQQRKICIILSFPTSSVPTGITYLFSMAFVLFLKLPSSLLPQALAISLDGFLSLESSFTGSSYGFSLSSALRHT